MSDSGGAASGSLTCQQVREMLSAFNDKELSDEEMRMVGEHIASCEKCSAESTQIAGLKKLMEHWEGVRASGAFEEKVLERVKAENERRKTRASRTALAVVAVILMAVGAFFLAKHIRQRMEMEEPSSSGTATVESGSPSER